MPNNSIDAFTLFKVVQSFNQNLDDLETTYLQLQSQFHPDKFVGKPISEQMNALTQVSIINDAYDTLTNPIKRSCLLLELNGFEDVLNSKPDGMLMAKQFELREGLDEAKDLKSFLKQTQNLQNECIEKLALSFENKNNNNAKDLTIELQFLTKFIQDIKKKIRQEKAKQ